MNPNKKRLRRTMMFLNAQKPGLIKDPYIYKPDSIMRVSSPIEIKGTEKLPFFEWEFLFGISRLWFLKSSKNMP